MPRWLVFAACCCAVWMSLPHPARAQSDGGPPFAGDSAADYLWEGLNLLHGSGVSVLIGGTLGTHFFEDSPGPPDYINGRRDDTNITDDYRPYPLLRITFPEVPVFHGEGHALPDTVGYRAIASGGRYTTHQKLGRDADHDGALDNSRYSASGDYVYAVAQMVARWGSLAPGQGRGFALAYGIGPGYSRFNARLENPKHPDGPTIRVTGQGWGWADVITAEVHLGHCLILGEVEQVHISKNGRYYGAGFVAFGVAYVWVL